MAITFYVYESYYGNPVVVIADAAVAKGGSLVLQRGDEEVARFAFSTVMAWKSETDPEPGDSG
jgi:hypothetical protein